MSIAEIVQQHDADQELLMRLLRSVRDPQSTLYNVLDGETRLALIRIGVKSTFYVGALESGRILSPLSIPRPCCGCSAPTDSKAGWTDMLDRESEQVRSIIGKVPGLTEWWEEHKAFDKSEGR